jgi:HAD superfamily hydrolase (TIGR01459 family)
VSEVIRNIDEIADRYDAVLCDVWGVVHNGRRPYAAACAALARLRRRGCRVVLITNVPKPRGPIPAQLDRIGVPRDAWDVIVTSGDAIRAELAARAPGPIYKIEPPGYDATLWAGLGLVEAPLREAAFIGISGLTRDDETPADYAELLREAAARDLEMLCANPDIVVQFGDRMIWCAGAIARDYEALGGRVVMAGKPAAPIYEMAYRELDVLSGRPIAKARILAIGDGIPTDIAGANAQTMDCVFVASGMHGEKLWTNGEVDLAKTESALAAENTHAAYVMQALA